MSQLNTCISYLFNYCCWGYKNYNDEENREMNSNICALKVIMCYSKISNNIKDCANKIYNSSDLMHSTCDNCFYNMKYILSKICCHRIEPMHSYWIRVGTLNYENNMFNYECTYEYINEFDEDNDNDIILLKNDFLNHAFYANDMYNPWISMKFSTKKENYTISRLISNDYKCDNFEKSNIRFLSIEYVHPEMDRRIPLEIDPSWYIVGNELFSIVMVKHLLEHQLENYKFDVTYTIFLMDNNIELYELKYDEYILLDKSKLFIMIT
jgi:hypothetical protein